MAENKSIRRSQAISPYGPGAILDWGQECFVVLDTRKGAWSGAKRIRLQRFESHLQVDFFKAPPLANEYGGGAGIAVQRFPSWLFCPRCRKMWRWGRDQDLEASGELPTCRNETCGNSILVPMRYVALCENGHLTDVDWWRWAHSHHNASEGTCEKTNPGLVFDARADKGSSLEALVIKCTKCGASRSLHDIGANNSLARVGQKCWGRQPWQGGGEEENCDASLQAMLRSQTAVHFSDTPSALDLKVHDDPADQELDDAMILVAIEGIGRSLDLSSTAAFGDFVELIADRVGERTRREITVDHVNGWLDNYFEETAPGTTTNLSILEEEWPALTTSTVSRNPSSPLIVTSRNWPSDNPGDRKLSGHVDAVYLVEKLREVRALRGFRRLKPDAKLVPPDLGIGTGRNWLPAVEVYGEGIFIHFSDDAVTKWEKEQAGRLRTRMAPFKKSISEPGSIANRFEEYLPVLPRFVLLHTFAHILIRQLCYECGYSGASVRERLYVFGSKLGLLIYTADGDSEGSLGGLVRQGKADRLSATIFGALERANWCSNDPICSELPPHGMDGLNRAACHACALAAETSCGHLNSLLDRELVIGHGEAGTVKGFFTDALMAPGGQNLI